MHTNCVQWCYSIIQSTCNHNSLILNFLTSNWVNICMIVMYSSFIYGLQKGDMKLILMQDPALAPRFSMYWCIQWHLTPKDKTNELYMKWHSLGSDDELWWIIIWMGEVISHSNGIYTLSHYLYHAEILTCFNNAPGS